MTLGALLREATRDWHAAVERSAFVQSLLRGRLERAAYCVLLRNLFDLYRGLQTGLRRHGRSPVLSGLPPQAIARTSALREDLEHLHGRHWRRDLPRLPATARYVRRLHACGPAALLAHVYVRCLGDLSGGQALRRCVSRAFGLAGPLGTRFYDFGPPAAAAALKDALRRCIDDAGLVCEAPQAVVAEAIAAFRLHADLFAELQRCRQVDAATAQGSPPP
ncbi:MAG: biliverdin-producing heme oxygenase [Burkholderiaceae bacterium]|nr:biliverdin-producing heme oxygenase [Burkholderiaceae bacterium]MCX8003449.1 biliverdin-producing heme oxygenase [Burkholderiaceae bacterium]